MDDAPVTFPGLSKFVEWAYRAEQERVEAELQAMLDRGQIPVMVQGPGWDAPTEVISTHEYVRRFGPPPLPRRKAGDGVQQSALQWINIGPMTQDRPPFTSDDEWLCMKARDPIPVPDGPHIIATVVLRNRAEPWRPAEVVVFEGDDGETEADQAEQVAWDRWVATGDTSHVEVTWSWRDVGDERTVTDRSHCPGWGEQRAGFRFTRANRDQWINL